MPTEEEIESGAVVKFRPGQPFLTIIELTLRCNLRCIHCGSTAGKKRKDELTTGEILALCADLASLNCYEIVLLGGEPFLHRDWYAIAEEIKWLGIKLAFVTNGMHFTEKRIRQLVELETDQLGISLDGGSPAVHDRIRGVPGSFDFAVNTLKMARDAGLEVTLVTTLHKMNLRDLPAIREIVRGTGAAWQIQISDTHGGRFSKDLLLDEQEFYQAAKFISDMRAQYPLEELPVAGSHNFGYHSKLIRNLQPRPEWPGCVAGVLSLGISSRGDVKGCLAQPDDFIEGNIRERNIIDIWQDPDAFSHIRKFKTSDLKGFCRDCPYGATCKGGCTSFGYAVTGEFYHNPYCLYRMEQLGLIPNDAVSRP